MLAKVEVALTFVGLYVRSVAAAGAARGAGARAEWSSQFTRRMTTS